MESGIIISSSLEAYPKTPKAFSPSPKPCNPAKHGQLGVLSADTSFCEAKGCAARDTVNAEAPREEVRYFVPKEELLAFPGSLTWLP